MKFGEKLAKLRKEKNLSQEELANQLNVSRQAVSKWENDQGYPETEKLLMIGNIFSVTMDYLLKEDSASSIEGNQSGYYASREVIQGYVNHARKELIKIDIAVMLFVLSGLPVLLFPHMEDMLSIVSMVMIVASIVMLTIMAFQEDPYKMIKKERLYFDNEVIKGIKIKYEILRKKYMYCIVLGICFIFACAILAILVDDVWKMEMKWVDGFYLFLIAGSIYAFIYGVGMMDIYELITENEKRHAKEYTYSYIYYVLIGIASVVYIALAIVDARIWRVGWAIVAVAAILAYGIVYYLEHRNLKK